ncbi:MAG: hypothetical protein JW938_07605 [Candidatus Omnitrophica bacterium]|nr:hypothetical protein [Candidatus Omnitrophota bacterium]
MKRVKNRTRLVLAVFCLWCACCAVVFAEEQQNADKEMLRVSTSVDKSIITIGEKITYTVRIMYNKDLEVILPEFVNSLGGFAVKDFGRLKEKKYGKDMREIGVWYLLDTYLVGSYIIPEITINAKDAGGTIVSVTTPEIFLEVISVVAEDAEFMDIRDIKTPRNIPFNKKTIVLICILAALMIGTLSGISYWYFIVRKRPKPIKIVLPHEAAYAELGRIGTLGLVEKGAIKEYYFLITACLRKYLEDRFALKALEQTTEEFVEDIVKRRVLEDRYNELLRDFLYHCDYVKFAKYDPVHEEIQKTFDTVKIFVDETKKDEAQEERAPENAGERT